MGGMAISAGPARARAAVPHLYMDKGQWACSSSRATKGYAITVRSTPRAAWEEYDELEAYASRRVHAHALRTTFK